MVARYKHVILKKMKFVVERIRSAKYRVQLNTNRVPG